MSGKEEIMALCARAEEARYSQFNAPAGTEESANLIRHARRTEAEFRAAVSALAAERDDAHATIREWHANVEATHMLIDAAGIPSTSGKACGVPSCKSHLQHRTHTALATVAALAVRLSAAADDLEKYGEHRSGCAVWKVWTAGTPLPCDCGYEAALQAARRETKET